MNKLTQELMEEEPRFLALRVTALKAEVARDLESLPLQALTWTSVALSLIGIALTMGIESWFFIVPSMVFGGFGALMLFGAICLRWNLSASAAALELQRAYIHNAIPS